MKIITLFLLTIVMMFISAISEAGEKFSVTVELPGSTVTITQLQTFEYGGERGYYFPIKVSVTNGGTDKRIFMVDDDCTFASWRLSGQPVKMLHKSCRKNVYENVSLNAGEKYSTDIKIWFPENYLGNEIKFNIGFIEIVDYKTVSGPYWSDNITLFISR